MKTLLTFLFLFLSIVGFSMDKKTQEYLFENYKTPYNLAYDIKQPTAFFKFNDFSTFYKQNTSPFKLETITTEQMIPFTYDGTVEWYKTDFAAEPFDGRIEILVMGEPLPSINLSLLIACIISIAVLQYRKYKERKSSVLLN